MSLLGMSINQATQQELTRRVGCKINTNKLDRFCFCPLASCFIEFITVHQSLAPQIQRFLYASPHFSLLCWAAEHSITHLPLMHILQLFSKRANESLPGSWTLGTTVAPLIVRWSQWNKAAAAQKQTKLMEGSVQCLNLSRPLQVPGDPKPFYWHSIPPTHWLKLKDQSGIINSELFNLTSLDNWHHL